MASKPAIIASYCILISTIAPVMSKALTIPALHLLRRRRLRSVVVSAMLYLRIRKIISRTVVESRLGIVCPGILCRSHRN